jgi:hypothetical protein
VDIDDLVPPLPEWVPPEGFVPEPPPQEIIRRWCPVCGLNEPPVRHTLMMKRCPGKPQQVRYRIVAT